MRVESAAASVRNSERMGLAKTATTLPVSAVWSVHFSNAAVAAFTR